jgi:hypothetical protein
VKVKTIMAKQSEANVKFELAKQIRTILDDARKAYGVDAWDEDDVETQICELVFEEG